MSYIKHNKKNSKKIIVIISIFMLSFISKVLQHTVLPKKYFYDSNAILHLTKFDNPLSISNNNFGKTALFFKTINIFNFTTLFEWSIFFAVIMSFFLLVLFIKYKYKTYKDLLFILSSIGLLNIYVFNISKEMIQMLFFIWIYSVIENKRLKNIFKIIYIFIINIIISITFRSYYILIGAYTVMCFLIIEFIRKNKITVSSKTIFKIVLFILVCVFLSLFISSFLFPEEYNEVLTVRGSVNLYRDNSIDAKTIIIDLIPAGKNLGLFMINYTINIVRMMFPLELLFKGIKYIPFIGYQIIITSYLLHSLKKILYKANNEVYISTCVYCGFLLGSALFEPDFGSWVRHQAAATFIMIQFSLSKN